MGKRTTYWKANAATSAKILEALKASDKIRKAASSIAKEVGAKGVYWTSGFTISYFSGFVFDREPDRKLWSPMKRAHNGWKPKRQGDGKALWKRMDALSDGCRDDIAKIIGMNCFNGLGCSTPGAHAIGKVVYIVVPEGVTPKGCTRISDLAYEKATSKKKAAKA